MMLLYLGRYRTDRKPNLIRLAGTDPESIMGANTSLIGGLGLPFRHAA